VLITLVVKYSRPLWRGTYFKVVNYVQQTDDLDPRTGTSPGVENCFSRPNWTTIPLEGSFKVESRTSIKFPVSLGHLLITNRGTLAHGVFEIIDDAPAGSDEMSVDIKIFHNAPLREIFDVCAFYQGADAMGVGIFTPFEDRFQLHRQKTHVEVALRLPKSRDGQLRPLKRLETELTRFTHRVPDLQHSFSFENLGLGSARGHSPVYVESVYGKVISVHTSKGAIVGSFNASNRVSLITTDALINADIVLDNDGVDQSLIQLSALNGPIDSVIRLTSSTKDKTGGSFRVEADSVDGDIKITIPTAPVKHNLALLAQTNRHGAHIDVTLDETFEGTFVVQSARRSAPFINWDEKKKDPSGGGKVRNVTIDAMPRFGWVGGHTEWVGGDDDGHHGEGDVLLRTTMADVTLQFDP